MQNNYLLNHKISGQGQPLVILHGFFGMLDNWKSFSTRLNENYRVILVDQRNHGRSFWSDSFSYELLAKDLILLLDHLEIEKAHIIGHSMGGKVTLQFANDYSERIDKGVIIDIGFQEYAASHMIIFDQILNMNPAQIESRNEADEILATQIKDWAVRQFLLKSLARNKEGSFRWKTNFSSLFKNYKNILSSIDVSDIQAPLLLIRGLHSDYIKDEHKVEIQKAIPNVEFADIEAGHWIHAEKPDELFERISMFL